LAQKTRQNTVRRSIEGSGGRGAAALDPAGLAQPAGVILAEPVQDRAARRVPRRRRVRELALDGVQRGR